MNHQLAVVAPQEIEVIAETPQEMHESNLQLIQWCDHKIKALRTDYIELDAAYKSAVAKKWKSSVLGRHAKLAKKRVEYYHKLKKALVMGFYIVPNFPVTVFALRTSKDSPLRLLTYTDTYGDQPHPTKEQQTESLSEGEGAYVNPNPFVQVRCHGTKKDERGTEITKWSSWASDWEKVDFPLCMAKPRIMEAVGRAMEVKAFDDFGVLSDAPERRRGCGDPIIVARILDPRSTTYVKKYVSFVVAWSLDTRTI